MLTPRTCSLTLLTLLAQAIAGSAAAQTLEMLGYPGLDPRGATVSALDSDGRTGAGFGRSGGENQGVVVTTSGEIQNVGDLPGGVHYAPMFGLSADGTTAVGESDGAAGTVAVRWTESTGLQALAPPPSGVIRSKALDVSGDGSVIVGEMQLTGQTHTAAFRFTDQTGMTPLPDALAGIRSSDAAAVSNDGSVIVGNVEMVGSSTQGFRWTEAEGMQTIPRLQWMGFGRTTYVEDVSADGQTIVGLALAGATSTDSRAIRWTAAEGTVELGLLEGASSSRASATSADGARAVGSTSTASGETVATLWLENGEAIDLNTLMETLGVDMTGWRLDSALAISDDGLTITGSGMLPNGLTGGWIATIPEPGTGLLVSCGLLALARRRARPWAS